MIDIVSNLIVSILDIIKAIVEAALGSGLAGAGVLLALPLILLLIIVFGLALNAKTS